MKTLTPSTIIPESLYVDRVADKQLSDIINDMGRPGYILVARQMGKTNLLISAKRKLEKPGDIFSYIDLSNRFDTDRECFRSIIDTILDTNPDPLDSIADEIYSDRESKSVMAHREHARELRKILSAISGKLIINLDEIDSLTAADYSDKIFAQIRSIYFERVNFKEYERLSYIISGVAEPSEIIKDKSISPFNIGQKILLGDFTYSEFQGFIEKANFSWEEEISKRVFFWSNGNPRLSWEICSFLEDVVLEGKPVTTGVVDKAVNDLYLAKYDRPPVDHVRALVQSDKELREAVVAISYEKSEILSDRVKSRLYLAGILGSDYEVGNVRIKNRIIEKSLDESWLSDLEKVDNLSINKAEDLFAAGNYEAAIEIYEHLVKEYENQTPEQLAAKYKLGLCYFHVGDYQKVSACYEDAIYDKNGFRDLYMDQLYTLGMSHYQLKEDKEALVHFDEIIADRKSPFYYEALMNKAAILVRTGEDDKRLEAIKLNETVIGGHNNGVHVKHNAISGAYYNVAILNEITDSETAFENYRKSSETADLKNKVTPLISAIEIKTESVDELIPIIKDALCSGEIKLDSNEFKTGLELNPQRLATLIGVLFDQRLTHEIDSILDLVNEHCLVDKAVFSDVLFEIAISRLTSAGGNDANYILDKAVSLSRDYSSPESIFNCNKYLSFIDEKNTQSEELYFKGFQNYIESCDVIDVRLFERKISLCHSNHENQKAVWYCDLIVDNEGLSSHSNRVKFLTILYLKMKSIRDKDELVSQASKVKEIINSTERSDLTLTGINEDTFKLMKQQTNQTLISIKPIKQVVRSERKYGRNEKVRVVYEDGREEFKKYKTVKESVMKGSCKIIHQLG